MRLHIKTTNIPSTPELTEYLERRLSALDKLTVHHEEEVIVDVEVGQTTRHHQSGDIYRAEINVTIGKTVFRAVQETEDLFTSIDVAKDQMLGELRSFKGKRISLARRGGQKIKALMRRLPWWRNNT